MQRLQERLASVTHQLLVGLFKVFTPVLIHIDDVDLDNPARKQVLIESRAVAERIEQRNHNCRESSGQRGHSLHVGCFKATKCNLLRIA